MKWQIEVLVTDDPEIVALIGDINADIGSQEDYLYWFAFIEEHRAFIEYQRIRATEQTQLTLARIEKIYGTMS